VRGNLGGIVGAIAGAIFGASFLFGLGALIGALGGAWLGCLVAEMPGRTRPEALRAAKGAFVGKALGFTVKTAIGASMVILSIPRIWP
jgi:outer membrane lipoprotein SlyB